MAFGEAFNPSSSHARDEIEREKLLPAPPPIAGAPPFEAKELDVVIPGPDQLDPFAERPRRHEGDGDV